MPGRYGIANWRFASRTLSGEPAARLHDEIECNKFIQFEFERQWCDLKAYCESNEIRIMGDVPIYVAQDSADVWANRDLFELDESGQPRVVSGVPPDYFSANGQLWGNPIYRWEAHAKTGYAWWIARLRRSLEMLDLIRLDHFRGFEAYYEIPGGELTAVNGAWVKGPGAPLFEALENALGRLPIVAENLGVITPAVEALRERFGFPGMAILQFAFGKDPQAPDFKPHNYLHHLVAYTGTHDNDTVVGWWTSAAGSRKYSHCDGRRRRTGLRATLPQYRRSRNQLGYDPNAAGICRRHRIVSVARCAGRRQRRQNEPPGYLLGKLALALPPRPADTGDGRTAEAASANLRSLDRLSQKM